MDEFWPKYKSYNRSNVSSAREIIKNPTPAEEKMRHEILKHRPWWYKFTRQKPLWSFILDFYILLQKNFHFLIEEYIVVNAIIPHYVSYLFSWQLYCSKLSLAIELDWEVHKNNKEYDKERTIFLSEKWISVIRYRNNEVIKNPDKIYKDILDYIKEIEK